MNNPNNKSIDNFNHLPFNVQWLDSSYQQTFLPDSPWQKVIKLVCIINFTFYQYD